LQVCKVLIQTCADVLQACNEVGLFDISVIIRIE
jgi:hypothetical protein